MITRRGIFLSAILLSAAKAGPLEGTQWLLEDLGGAGVIDRLQSTLKFEADGKCTGNAGCNRFSGSWKLKKSNLTISEIISTYKSCSPAVMNQESKFVASLQKSTRFRFDEVGFLLIFYRGNQKPLRFSPLTE